MNTHHTSNIRISWPCISNPTLIGVWRILDMADRVMICELNYAGLYNNEASCKVIVVDDLKIVNIVKKTGVEDCLFWILPGKVLNFWNEVRVLRRTSAPFLLPINTGI